MSTQSQEEIADCATCGGMAYEAFDYEQKRKPPRAIIGHRVECSDCDQVGPTCATDAEAIERWNAEQTAELLLQEGKR